MHSSDLYYHTPSFSSDGTLSYIRPRTDGESFDFSSHHREFLLATRIGPRTERQLEMIDKGSRPCSMASLMLLVSVYLFLGVLYGNAVVVLFTLSILPASVFLGLLRWFSVFKLPIDLMVEMVWAGAILSILSASILEFVSQVQTRRIWLCQAKDPSLSCDLRFILVVIVGVGFVEEVSKFLPLSRLKTHLDTVPRYHTWWFRLVLSPQALVLAGASSAAGFSGVENLKYVFSSNAGLETSVWRALLAIPFHLACTTYASCKLAKLTTKPMTDVEGDVLTGSSSPAERVAVRSTGPQIVVQDGWPTSSDGALVLTTDYVRDDGSPASTPFASLYDGRADRVPVPMRQLLNHQLSLFQYFQCLFIPGVLHGLYDAGLFLWVQLIGLADPQQLPSSVFLSSNSTSRNLLTFIFVRISRLLSEILPMSKSSSSPSSSPASGSSRNVYEILAFCCAGISLMSYVLILVLTFRAFRDVQKLSSYTTNAASSFFTFASAPPHTVQEDGPPGSYYSPLQPASISPSSQNTLDQNRRR